MRPSTRLYRFLLIISLCCAVLAPAARAQETNDLTRDPTALASSLLGVSDPAPLPPLNPYEVGDTLDFWVARAGSDTPVRVTAALAAAEPNVYLWVEEGIDTEGANLTTMAANLGNLFQVLRIRANYEQNTPVLPDALVDTTDLLPLPDADDDPHLYILFSRDLKEDVYYNPIDSLSPMYAPGGYGTGRETIYLNTTPFPGIPLNDPVYQSAILRSFYNLMMAENAPGQAAWLNEAMFNVLLFRLQETQVSNGDIASYFQAPDTPLLRPGTLTTRSATNGLQQLFLRYFAQRYGSALTGELFLGTGADTVALDEVLAEADLLDPVTNEPITARDAYADFVIANLLNTAFGDGRYVHEVTSIPQGLIVTGSQLQGAGGGSVNPFGTAYYFHTAQRPQRVTLTFTGDPTLPRLAMPSDRAADDVYYWSGRGQNQHRTLTRAIDLSGVEEATLTFDAWYDLAEGWHYGYVSVSEDDGTTWDILATDGASALNRNGAAYGQGFTGISNPDGPRPFPILGVVVTADGMTLGEVTPGGPADQAGILPGDVVVGYDGEEWPGVPNIVGLLGNYTPGDTLTFLIERAGERVDVPVVLGAHPTRVVQPAPLWQPQQLDLTPYAGQEILLRFETITLPGRDDNGFAVDNIAIPEIDFLDDASEVSEDWTLAGWSRVDNQVPARWLLQTVTTGTATEPPRVQRLIDPDGGSVEGEWRFALDPNESLLVAISSLNDDTTERATYALRAILENR
jgi:hypothetical protein